MSNILQSTLPVCRDTIYYAYYIIRLPRNSIQYGSMDHRKLDFQAQKPKKIPIINGEFEASWSLTNYYYFCLLEIEDVDRELEQFAEYDTEDKYKTMPPVKQDIAEGQFYIVLNM